MQDLHPDAIDASMSLRTAVRESSRELRARTRAIRSEFQEMLAQSRVTLAQSRGLLGRPLVQHELAASRLDARSVGSPLDRTRERLRLLESVVVHANDAVLITEAAPIDLPGPRILYCNAAFTKMTGYTETELHGRTPRMLQGPQTDRAVLDEIRRHIEAWEPVRVELLNYRKDGSPFWIELSIVPVADATGLYTHWISLQRDVSDRKAAAEAALRTRLAELEKQALEAEIEGRKLVEQRLFQAAFHDDLTRLHNRAYLLGRMGSLLGQLDPGEDPQTALLFMDLDRFKFVNDTLGHGVGDQLLIEVARRLSACVTGDDVVARMGGDEFALLVDISAGIDTAIRLSDRIVQTFDQPFKLGDHTIRSSGSIGIAPLTSRHPDAEAVLRDADIAMYRSKRTGGRRPALFTEDADAETVRALSLQSDLIQALERDEFHLLYQPIFSAEPCHPASFEALIRWQHPARGPIPPDVFIPLAEECGAARAIGRWVLKTALCDMRLWAVRFPDTGIRLNVNVSPNELLDERFVAEVLATLGDAGLPAGSLELEITETVFQARSPHVLRTLQQLRAAGIRLALDDFGTGYSSLGSIDSYPINTLKIDKTFVRGMMLRPRTRALVETIITLADALGLDVVAEGVETELQYQALIAMGCHHFQGYHLGHPMPLADAMAVSGTGLP